MSRSTKTGYRGEPSNKNRFAVTRSRLCLAPVRENTRCILSKDHEGKCRDRLRLRPIK